MTDDEWKDRMRRKPGWYWVRRTGIGHWEIAIWQGDVWFITSSTYQWSDDEFEEIGPRVEPPSR